MVTPIMLIRAVVDGMASRRFGRIVNITSRSVKAPLAHLGLSNGARAGLTGFVAGLSRQVAKHNVAINNLLPGPFLTDRQKDGLGKLAAKADPRIRHIPQGARDARPTQCRLRHARGIRQGLRVPVRR